MSLWDTSAIVPLCRNEDRSQLARHLWLRFPVHYVWRESVVEVSSTLARLERQGILAKGSRVNAERRLRSIETQWIVIEPTDLQIDLAREFPAKYGLRTLDSLQLAAALVWCKEFPKNRDFIAADAHLLKAAKDAGFAVHDLS